MNIVAVTLRFVTPMLAAQANTDRGASLVEYAILVALIAVVCIAAVTTLGKNAGNREF